MRPDEFARRRRRLLQMMGEGAIAILPAPPVCLRNRHNEYPYRPDSDLFYLTGFPEPEAVLVLIPGRSHGEYILFCRERDPRMEQWSGARAGQEGAVQQYGADDSFPISDIDDILPGLLENRSRVYYTMGRERDFDQRLIGWIDRLRDRARSGVHAPDNITALEHLLHEMRLIKSAAEIKAMRRAAAVTVQAHRRAMRLCRPGLHEYQIEAELLHQFVSEGCRSPAYSSIVAAGGNGCILHYTANSARMRSGELLLVDAGAEYQNYAADVTTTFPVSGRFRPAQRALYNVVLAAQREAIATIAPGRHWNEPHEAAVRAITEGLVELGLLRGRVATLIRKESYKRFFMHRTGHWLGMDVHDVGEYKVGESWRMLEPGMVMTVEPGVYIPAGSRGVDRKWWNIGIRIEDDVLVTRDGCEILSAGLPRTVEEIEAFMSHE
ncbi:MAG TPA: Xaa-Pro aminopeptidase [Gammaproteobacteria bacterium]|nr:Xaa-Pro aminopeptidase [Gammaproteobacteria bacterium]